MAAGGSAGRDCFSLGDGRRWAHHHQTRAVIPSKNRNDNYVMYNIISIKIEICHV